MKIPQGDSRRDRFKRFDFFRELIGRCRVSRDDRRVRYTSRRYYWLYGTDASLANTDIDLGTGPPAANKIWPHLDQLTAFLYSQETTRFSTELGAAIPLPYRQWLPVVNNQVNTVWHASNTDIIFGAALLRALVFDSMFIKPLWRGNVPYPGVVYPHNFGVLREDTMMLSKQEAFCHWYSMTLSQARNDFAMVPRLEEILRKVATRASGMIEAQEAGIDRIVMSAQSPLGGTVGPPTGVGTVDWMSEASLQYVPRVKEELIEMCELYVWDDRLHDYRIATFADPDIPIFDRPNEEAGGLPHDPPFIQICPNPDPHYFWGISEVERLIPLQMQRNRYLAQIDHLCDLQAHPPSTTSGFPGDLYELQYTLDTPNGLLNQPDPAGTGGGGPRAERIQIELPADLYARLERNDADFENTSGLPPITQGKNPPGVRAGGHAMDLAKLGSARARKRALIIEDSLEALATYTLKLMRKYDPTHFEAEVQPGKKEKEEFILKQLPDDFLVKVDAHSNSPIFVDDLTALVFQLLKGKMITRKSALRMLSIPNREQLIYELENEIEPLEAKQHQEQEQFELKKAQLAGIRGRARGSRANGGGVESQGTPG
jgi:hypothetical protein